MSYLKQLCFLVMATLVIGCSDDDGMNQPPTTGDEITYQLAERSDSGVSGSATIEELDDGTSRLTIDLSGTPSDGMHPSHIHMNTAAEGGGIIVSLNEVDGSTGMSETIISEDDNGNMITYQDLLNIDGYINVHLSADDLATVVAQGDIGQNALTGESKMYNLTEGDVDGINGSVLFEERMNGEALATIMLEGTPDGEMHPAHIHMNTAAEGGGILYTFTPVDGTSGMSRSNVATLDDDSSFGYGDVLNVDGYVNVHLSADNLATIVAQGDIGQNELTGESKMYNLAERDVDGINGSVLFEERMNGEAQATIMLNGTPDGGMHPAHIHMNSFAEGGGILYTFNPVNGTSGMSRSNVAALDDGTSFGYADVLDVDGYVNVHLSADDLATIVAQGDVGQNELTGETITYDLGEKDVPGISGAVTFEERMNGEALATIMLDGTPDGGSHPAHIHQNSASEGGPILYTFTPVDGSAGMSRSNVAMLDDGSGFVYADVLSVDGYVNVHLSADDLGTIVAQGNVGANAE
jgi:hypothetical protein